VDRQPVALVTGASSGIGQATAELLVANGFTVFGTSRTPDAGAAHSYTLLPLDVRLDRSVDAAVRAVLDAVGRIDVLINNAGYAQSGAIEENSITDAQAQFETNVFGVMRMTNGRSGADASGSSPVPRPVQHQSDLTAIDAAIAVAPKPFRLIFTILCETGMRVGEVLALSLNETVLCIASALGVQWTLERMLSHSRNHRASHDHQHHRPQPRRC
jgi:NAD(P)-dependent dehydrogenase (short-subunit alcohol dehydrogenase family)